MAKVKFSIKTVTDNAIIKVIAYDEKADYVYRNVKSEDIIMINGYIENNVIIKEINIFEDGYHLFEKIDINPYDYGIILKISDKMVDKYSLIAFAALLRNEINVERLLFKNNSNSELSDVKNKVEELYNKISESIDHVRDEISIIELNNIINEIFYFGLNDNEIQNVSSLFDDISKDYVDIDIKAKTGSGNIVSVPKNDICYIFLVCSYCLLFH